VLSLVILIRKKGYKVEDLDTYKVNNFIDIVFYEKVFPFISSSPKHMFILVSLETSHEDFVTP